MIKKYTLCTLILALISAQISFADLLLLDPTFGQNLLGTTTTDITPGQSSAAIGVAIKSNDKIVVGGTSNNNFAVAQYSSSGNLDKSNFNNPTGYITTSIGTSSQLTGIALQSNGSVVATGTSTVSGSPIISLARYLSTGLLDTSNFGNPNGYVTTFINGNELPSGCVIQPGDQKIVVAGSTDNSGTANIFVARYGTNGSLDTANFGNPNGYVQTAIGSSAVGNAVALQGDGKIVVAGQGTDVFSVTMPAVVRYNGDGSLDTTNFGNPNGYVLTNIISNLAVTGVGLQSSGGNAGKIVIAGYFNGSIGLIRFSTSGALDTSFGTDADGGVRTVIGTSVTAVGLTIDAADDTIVVSGAVDNKPFVARYTADGLVDTTFGVNGLAIVDLCDQSPNQGLQPVVVDANSKPVAAGFCENSFLLARFLNNNSNAISILTPVDSSTLDVSQIQIAGTSSNSNTIVRISIDGNPVTAVITDVRGNWNAGTSASLSYGDHTVTADLMVDSTILATATNTVTLHPFLNEIVFAATSFYKATTTVPDFEEDTTFGISPLTPIIGWRAVQSSSTQQPIVLQTQIPKDISPTATDVEIDLHFVIADALASSGSNVRFRVKYTLEGDGTTIQSGDLVAVSGSDVSVSESTSPKLNHYKTTITLNNVSGLAAQKWLYLVFDRVSPSGGSEYTSDAIIVSASVRYPH